MGGWRGVKATAGTQHSRYAAVKHIMGGIGSRAGLAGQVRGAWPRFDHPALLHPWIWISALLRQPVGICLVPFLYVRAHLATTTCCGNNQ